MAVTVAPTAGIVPYYLPWQPTQMQVVESDTAYLMDLNVEQGLTAATQRLMGADEEFGDTASRPPWLGGTKTTRIAGKFRDGLQSADPSNGYVYLPVAGLINPAQGTIEFWVMSSVSAWSALSFAEAFLIQNYPGQIIELKINASAIQLNYQQGKSNVSRTLNTAASYSFAAGVWVSVAFTWNAGTITLYVNGTSAGTLTGCTAPVMWLESWDPNSCGLKIPGGAQNLAMSDLRISHKARTPGVTPS